MKHIFLSLNLVNLVNLIENINFIYVWKMWAVLYMYITCCSSFLFNSGQISFHSLVEREDRKWQPSKQNPQDYRLWSGARGFQDNQDECSWDLCLDGPRSHQNLNLLQEQWCLEVSPPRLLSLTFPCIGLSEDMVNFVENYFCSLTREHWRAYTIESSQLGVLFGYPLDLITSTVLHDFVGSHFIGQMNLKLRFTVLWILVDVMHLDLL